MSPYRTARTAGIRALALHWAAALRCGANGMPARSGRHVDCAPAKDRNETIDPGSPTLQAILDTVTDNLTFLTTQFGKPFTSNGFGNWFRNQCNAAGLPQCSAHGLRKAAARRLAEAGCTAHEIASITGHASLKQIAHYTRAADQGRLASAAMEKVKTRTSSG